MCSKQQTIMPSRLKPTRAGEGLLMLVQKVWKKCELCHCVSSITVQRQVILSICTSYYFFGIFSGASVENCPAVQLNSDLTAPSLSGKRKVL
jgi:hypothetical protein